MIALTTAVTSVLLIFVSQASAGDDKSCINATLPNILGIGECLGTAGDLCSSGSEGIVNTVIKLVECVLSGVGTLDLNAQLHLTAELVGFILERLGLGELANLIGALCSDVEKALKDALKELNLGFLSTTIRKLIKCRDFKVTGLICKDDIIVNLPSALNAGNCLGDTLTTCDGKTPVDINVLEGIVNSQLCVLQSLSEQDLTEVVSGLGCSVLEGISTGLGGLGSVLEPVLGLLGGVFGENCG
ncbi:unnamed protein product [Ixodes persulcatus]